MKDNREKKTKGGRANGNRKKRGRSDHHSSSIGRAIKTTNLLTESLERVRINDKTPRQNKLRR